MAGSTLFSSTLPSGHRTCHCCAPQRRGSCLALAQHGSSHLDQSAISFPGLPPGSPSLRFSSPPPHKHYLRRTTNRESWAFFFTRTMALFKEYTCYFAPFDFPLGRETSIFPFLCPPSLPPLAWRRITTQYRRSSRPADLLRAIITINNTRAIKAATPFSLHFFTDT